MSAPEDRREGWHRFFLWFFAVVVFAGGSAFVYKLYEFLHDLTAKDGLHFAGSHLLTYILVAGGFLLLLAYGYLRGHFAKIESPKYEMLENEIKHDREELTPSHDG